jgi:hypothetical protein
MQHEYSNEPVRRTGVRRLGAVAVTLAVMACSVSAAPRADELGTAAEPTPFSGIQPDVLATMQAQAPLSRAAGALLRTIDRHGLQGLAGTALEGQAVVLWWKGAVPAALETAIARARQRVQVEVRPAAYTHAELRDAALPVGRRMREDPSSPVHQIDIAVDGSGLVFVTEQETASAQAWTSSVQVPVRVEVRPRVTLASRYSDTAPYWGGAAIINQDNGARCTSGFSVYSGSTNFLLTAGHCGRVGGGWWNGDRSRTIGTSSALNAAHDLMLIPTVAAGRIYDGGVGTGEFSKGVVGWDWVHSGEYVCQSGSTSGAVCGIQNTGNFTYQFCDTDTYGNYECFNDLILARRPDNGVAVRPGDSGGPVFSLAGTMQVTAKGTVTGYASDSNCFACYLIYQDFGTAWRDFGILPATSY